MLEVNEHENTKKYKKQAYKCALKIKISWSFMVYSKTLCAFFFPRDIVPKYKL